MASADLGAGAALFTVEAMVRGYHVYKDVWSAALGEQLSCQREPTNTRDPLAVEVVRSLVTVGHIPRKISSICSMFLLRGGTITCRVTASRRYSGDLPQGGLEIPCLLTFKGTMKDIAKITRLVKYALSSPTDASDEQPPKKKKRCDSPDSTSCAEAEGVIIGEKLSDIHINFAQQLLKQQFPQLNGLKSTLLQSKENTGEFLPAQIHCHSRDHWIVASTNACKDGDVCVYDSVFSTLDKETNEVVANLFPSASVKVIKSQKQAGGTDCGLFAIATATVLAYGTDLTSITFIQAAMRSHLVQCFTDRVITLFPVSLN